MGHHQKDIGLRNADGSGRGQKRHVSANVARLFPDQYAHDGAIHQHVWIDALKALDGGADYPGNVFVAIRITDGGVGTDIPFKHDTPVEMQGMFIPASEADPGPDNNGLPVLHFTHHPVGFVIYQGKEYQ